MIGYLLLPLFLVPAAALIWRVIVSKTRTQWLRAGAAAAAMFTIVGAVLISGELSHYTFGNWRTDLALLAASSGSLFLLYWSQRKHGNRRHRTISLLAAIIGLVPVAAAILGGLLFGGEL